MKSRFKSTDALVEIFKFELLFGVEPLTTEKPGSWGNFQAWVGSTVDTVPQLNQILYKIRA
jgi:hypothetical protein